MISRSNGFFSAHWDWLLAGVGLVALAASTFMLVNTCGIDPDEAAADALAQFNLSKKGETGVKPVDMSEYRRALQQIKSPSTVPEVAEKDASFLISGRRVFCELCQKPIPGTLKVCPYCNGKQAEPETVVLDSDGDGIPNDWESAHGMNPDDAADINADNDNDGFTNLEEYEAKTDPADPKSHPDYLDFVKIELPLTETRLSFYFKDVAKIPNGLRFQFFDPKKKNSYGQVGTTYAVLEGEEIGKTGFVVLGYEQKTKNIKIQGGGGAERPVDVSEITIERKSDGRKLVLVIGEKRKPVDVKAKLVFDRGSVKEFVVVPGNVIELYSEKYKVTDIKSVNKGARVTLENLVNSKVRTIEALEQ